MQRKNIKQYKDGYAPISQEEPDNVESDSMSDVQFEQIEKQTTPWKTILFAALLLILGVICLAFSAVIFMGYASEKYDDRAWPAFIIGWIMFIPGSYYISITLCVLLKFPGYSYDDIPQFNS